MPHAAGIDSVTLEVFWNRLIAAVNEQAAALMRTSFTSIVRDSGDLSAGIFDARGRMIAQAVTGTPGHINSMATCLPHFFAVYPAEMLQPGDVLITNDPWQTAGQLNDLTIITPTFHGGKLVGFFGNTCHAIDVGGRILSADSREVFEEGIQIPITYLYRAGEPNAELFKLLQANVRAPEQVLGDVHAQVASNDVGARQLRAFMDEFGLDSIEPIADEIVERSEAATRAAIRQIRPGVYEDEMYADGYEDPVTIHTTVTVGDGEVTVDFTGSSPQSRYGINVVLNYTHAYAVYAIKCALESDVPNNEGSFRPINVTAPEGSILNCQRPAAVGARHVIGHMIPGAVFRALAPALPNRAMAEGAGNIWQVQLRGWDPTTNRPFAYVWFSAGGMGARPTKDGPSNVAFPSGISGVPTEVVESLSPVLIRRKEIRTDSAGPGKFRGGFGQTMEIEVRTDRPYILSSLYDRTKFAPRGLFGGHDGAKAIVALSTGERPHTKQSLVLEPGVGFSLQLPGGGGFGDPRERDPDAVAADVEAGLVSAESARQDYAVAIDPAGTINWEETRRLRAT